MLRTASLNLTNFKKITIRDKIISVRTMESAHEEMQAKLMEKIMSAKMQL